MDSLTVAQWKNKFKRLIIEFHHHKNNTSYNRRVIHKPDLSKPLLSLRAPYNEQANVSYQSQDTDEDHFREFSDLEDIEEEDDDDGHYNIQIEPSVAKAQRVMMGALSSYILRRPQSSASGATDSKVLSCHCVCHELIEGTQNTRDIYYHLEECERICHLPAHEANAALSFDIMAKLMEEGINYIEVEEKPKKKKFLFLRSLFPSVHRPHIHHISRSTDTNTHVEKHGPSVTVADKLKVHEEDKSSEGHVVYARDGTEVPETLGPIEIIAVSSGVPPDSLNEDADSTVHPDSNEDPLHTSTEKEEEEQLSRVTMTHNMKNTYRNSSYSRRPLKPMPSMISLAKVDSESVQEKRSQRAVEPWKVVMNDVSLHAALLSSGIKPPHRSKSSLNLVADFTSSKHYHLMPLQLKQRAQQRFFSNETITDEYFYNYNDGESREEEDLLDMSSTVIEADSKTKENIVGQSRSYQSSIKTTSAQIHNLLKSDQLSLSVPARPLTSADQSILSGLMVPTQESLRHSQSFSPYDDMLLAYDYSEDEETECEPATKKEEQGASASSQHVLAELLAKRLGGTVLMESSGLEPENKGSNESAASVVLPLNIGKPKTTRIF